MLIAVAGASGRLGRRLMAYFKRQRMPALALLRSRASISSLPKGTPYRLVHPETGYGLREALRNVTHIVNASGSIDTTLSERALFEANVATTSHLLSCAPPKLKRLVQISSIAVYGKHPAGIVDEHSPRRPDDAYSRTKLAAERLALDAAHRMPIVVVQPGIIYGPAFTAGFYPMLSGLASGQLAVIGKGNNHLPLVHVDDVVAGIYACLATQGVLWIWPEAANLF